MNPLGIISVLPHAGSTSTSSGSTARSAPSNNGVFWRGADGQVYIKGGSGTNAAGSWDGGTQSYWGSRGFSEIADPNAPSGSGRTLGDTTTAPTAPTGGAAAPVLNQAAVNNTQLALDQLPALLQAALEAENTSYGNIRSGFDEAERGQRGTWDKSTTTNQQNYDSNYMDSIRAGVKGLGGLMNILRGTGAAGGTAQDNVRDIVGGVTSNDIRTGADTQMQNQTSLDAALNSFLGELKGKRQMADDTFENNKRAYARDNATQMQDLLGKMAGFYGEAGMNDRASDFMGRAGALTPQIAQNSAARVSNYDRTPVNVKAPELTAFAAPTQPEAAVVPDNGQVGSGIFTMNRRREQEQTPVALPVGA